MNISGHAGLTLGAVYAAGYLLDVLSAQIPGPQSPGWKKLWGLLSRLRSWPTSIERIGLDLRMVIVGSLLPDIIDKPLGLFLFPELVNFNARSVGHSLSFNMAILAVSLLFLAIYRFRAPLTVAIFSLGHLFLDEMWRWPGRFLWPLYGLSFPRGTTSVEEWLSFQFSGRWLDPLELLGGLFLFMFAFHLYSHRIVWHFFRAGTLGYYPQGPHLSR